MPLLNWSPSALAALQYKGQREAMTRLFNAYFRVAEGKDLTGTILHLDFSIEGKPDSIRPAHVGAAMPSVRPKPGSPAGQPDENRYHFFARFTKNNGWVAHATLKPEYRIISKGVENIFPLIS
jgi:hypothetical protein